VERGGICALLNQSSPVSKTNMKRKLSPETIAKLRKAGRKGGRNGSPADKARAGKAGGAIMRKHWENVKKLMGKD